MVLVFIALSSPWGGEAFCGSLPDNQRHFLGQHCVPYQRLLKPICDTQKAWLGFGGLNYTFFDKARTEVCGHLCAHVQIISGRVYIAKIIPGPLSRLHSFLLLLMRTVAAFPSIPDVEFLVDMADLSPQGPFFAACTERSTRWPPHFLVPVYSMVAWTENKQPAWQHMREELVRFAAKFPIRSKMPKMMYRGALRSESRLVR